MEKKTVLSPTLITAIVCVLASIAGAVGIDVTATEQAEIVGYATDYGRVGADHHRAQPVYKIQGEIGMTLYVILTVSGAVIALLTYKIGQLRERLKHEQSKTESLSTARKARETLRDPDAVDKLHAVYKR